MRVLYVSSYHITLEYNDLRLLSHLGIDWFSIGYYLNPRIPHAAVGGLRGPIGKGADPKILAAFLKHNRHYKITQFRCNTVTLTAELVNMFDIIYFAGSIDLLIRNWNAIKHKRVFLRTYGDQSEGHETHLLGLKQEGLKIIRTYSGEVRGDDEYLIRCWVDEDYYNGWIGDSGNILTFHNFFKERSDEPAADLYAKLRSTLSNRVFSLHGIQSKFKHQLVAGQVSSADQLSLYRGCGAYFSIPSWPAGLTYNLVEALLVGCPVITVGLGTGRCTKAGKTSLYEVTQLFENTKHLFFSDRVEELIEYTNLLLDNKELANRVSKEARDYAISVFGKETTSTQLMEVFKSA